MSQHAMRKQFACLALACLAGVGPTQSQTAVKPLLTQPTEKQTIAFGFRDWSPPALIGNTVISSNEHSPGGLYALDIATGKPKWIFRPATSALSASASAALIVGDRVIAGFGGATDGAIIAVALATGKELWRVPAMVQYRLSVVDDAIIAFGEERDNAVRALDVASGKERWRVQYPEGIGPTGLQVREGMVYFTARFLAAGARFPELFAVALDAKTGREQWRYRLEKDATRLYVTSNALLLTYDNYLYGVNRQTGQELWKVRQLYRTKKDSHGYDKDYLYNIGNIIEVGGQVVGRSDEALVGINTTTGQYDWEMPGSFHKGSAWMAVAGSVLYFQGNLNPTPPPVRDGIPGGEVSLNAMDMTTRRILWSFRRAADKSPDWGLSTVPFDGGLWASAFGALIRLQ